MSGDHPPRKEKRRRPENGDDNSFISHVRSRMSSLLPSTIVNWFGNSSSSNINGSAPVPDSDSSTEDDTQDIIAPPAKRMRYTSPIKVETKTTSTNTEPTETYSNIIPNCNSSFRPAIVSTPIASLIKEKVTEKEQEPVVLSRFNQKSIVKARTSLFERLVAQPPVVQPPVVQPPVVQPPVVQPPVVQPPVVEEPCSEKLESKSAMDHTEPYCKPALFGSPFYPGQTRYGGAGNTYMNLPNIKHKKDKLLSNSSTNDNINVSYATRCIMDLLENYSSPLIEAKRISQFAQLSSSFDESSPNKAYKTQELSVPRMAKILQLKKRSRLMDTTSAARQIIASHSSSQAYAPNSSIKKQCNNSTTSTETTLTTKDKTAGSEVTTNKSDTVNLPTAVLEIDKNNLPKFTFATSTPLPVFSGSTTNGTATNPASSTVTRTTVVTATSTGNGTTTATKFETTDHGNVNIKVVNESEAMNNKSFKFSRPLMINVQIEENTSLLPNYTFGIPDRQKIEEIDNKSLPITNKTLKPEVQLDTWKCNDCWVSNKADTEKCVCCNGAKPLEADSKMKQCTVCKIVLSHENFEKCIACEKKNDKTNQSVTNLNEPSKWKYCWVNNDRGENKCICCGGKKSEEIDISTAKYESVDSEWKCEVCWIKNKISVDRCAACGGPKQNSVQNEVKDCKKPNVSNIQASNTSSIQNIKSLQNDKWECPICLVRNEKNKGICVCCEAERPDKIKEANEKCFQFSTVPNTTFKFGIEPTPKPNEKIETQSDTQLKDVFKDPETNNNVVSNPPMFNFGLSKPKMVVEETIAEEENPKQTFTFGIAKSIASTTTPVTNLFGSSIEAGLKSTQPPNLIEVDEKCQEVPNLEESNVALPQNIEKPVGLFGIPLNTQSVPTTASDLVTFGQVSQNIINTPNVTTITTTAVDTKVSTSTFSFTACNINTGLQLFSAAATTVSETPTLQTCTTSSISFFQKIEPVNSSPITFFSKTEPTPSALQLFNKTETTTTVSVSSLSSTPVFSFGASNQVISAEKPKFNFTFGNKSDSPLFTLQSPSTSNNNLLGNGLASRTASNTTPSGLSAGITVGNNFASNSVSTGGLVGTAKKENSMWSSSNQINLIKMASESNLDQSANNLPAIPSGNPFGIPAMKDMNTWSLNQNNSNNNMGLLQLPTGNNVDSTKNVVGASPGSIFGTPEKKGNMWPLSNMDSNMFATNAASNNVQKPISFSFNPSMQFSSSNVTPTATFGNLTQPTQNIFGLNNQVNNNQSNMFSSTIQNQSTPNMFGAQAGNNNSSSMFATLNTNTAFGRPHPSTSTFDIPPMMTPTPTFNFGAQQVPGVFGFGQQQPQAQQGGVYNFGAQTSFPSAPRRFNIGSAGASLNATARRPIRRAVRRSFQQ